ncbi:WD40 repeat domain-containing protein, partial [Zavarzinella formosa]|uniref:WD40 repeat domain-containing protein n=1 Tax=Zavarzinella formosa TaxID=360055 RepID=UPI00138AD63F
LLAVAVSPDGKTAAVGGAGYYFGRQPLSPVFLINLRTGALARSLTDAVGSVMALSYSRDGALLGAATTSGEIVVWNPRTGDAVLKLKTSPDPKTKKRDTVTDIAFSPADANVFATVSGNGDLHVFTVNPAKETWEYLGKALAAHSKGGDTRVAWHPDGDVLVTGGGDECLGVWKLDGARKAGDQLSRLSKISKLGGQAFAIRYRPDGNGVVVAFAFGSTRTRVNPILVQIDKKGVQNDLLEFTELPDRQGQIVQIPAAAAVHISPDKSRRTYAFTGYDDHSIRLLVAGEEKGKTVRRALGGLSAGAWAVGFDADGTAVGWS